MGIRLDYKDESRKSWGRTFGTGERATLDIEQINCGAILRIADAVEAIAKNYTQLITDRDMYERWYREEKKRSERLTRSNNALRGHIKRVKR